MEDIRDIKPPVDLPADYFFWFVLLEILILGGIAFWVRFLILRSKQPKKILIPAKSFWDIALERLNALRQQNLPQQGQVKEFYSQLSNIIRWDKFYAIQRPVGIYCGHGDKIFWPHGLPHGVSFSLDPKISSPNPESWR